MFKRPARNLLTRIRHVLIPPGGWLRATRYNLLRLLRITDDPRSTALGAFAGTFVAFTPFFGVHFLLAPLLAWIIGGNVLASLLLTMICNPLTFPLIAYLAVSLGNWILRTGEQVNPSEFEGVFEILWYSFLSVFSNADQDWNAVSALFKQLLMPYIVGGSIIGLVAASVVAWLSLRAINSFQKLRRRVANRKRGI